MRISEWKKYEYEKGDRLPSGLSIEVCETNASSEKTDSIYPNQIITTYKNYYFLGNDIDDICPKGIMQSSEWAEKQVLDLIRPEQRRQWDEQSVKQILAWKTGKINHKTTEEKKSFDYVKGWREDSFAVQLPHQQPMDTEAFRNLAITVVALHKEYCDQLKDKDVVWKKLLQYVNDNNIAGLGSVYLITLLFFITNGECPIYDRFAMAALASFELSQNGINVPDGAIIRGCGLPDRKSNDAYKLLSDSDSKYVKYQGLLESFFDDAWKSDRDIDRALWVYGHKFDVTV